MSQGPSQVDDYTDSYEVNADDFDEQRVAAEANGSDDCCIVLSDEESQGIAVIEHVVDNVVDNGGVTCEEVTETAAKNDDEDDSEDEVEDEQAELERAKVEPGFFADELELLDLTLPHPTFIRDKAVKKWNSRKLIVYPVTEDELETPQMIGLLKDPHCTQVTIHLDREKPSVESRMNFLDLVFDSKEETLKATEELKSINSSFNVLNATDVGDWNKDFDKSRSVHFSDYETKKWPSCLVCVKYLPRNITEEKLREIFPDAFEVLIYTNDRPNLTDAQRCTSFLFYRTPEEARMVVETNNEKKTSVDDVHLAFLKYDQSTRPQLISPSLLAMSERYLILKEKRMVEKLEKISGGNCAAALEKFNIKLKEDEMVRKTYSLPTPTVEEMRAMPNLKILKGIEALKIIKQKGLLWRNQEKLLSADSSSLETPVHPENKGLHSDVTNPNKRKRKKITLETKTVPFAAPRPAATGPPSLLQTAVDPAARPPQRKVMRLVQETDFTTFNEDDVFATAATEYGMMYPAPPPPPRRLRPHMERPPMMRPPMPRGMPPRGMPPRRGMAPRGMPPRGMPPGISMARLMVSRPSSMTARPAALGAQQRPAGGYPLQPRITNQLSSRLMRLAHGDPVSSGTSVSTVTCSAPPPRQLMTRPSTSLSSAAPRQLMAQMARPRSAGFGGRGPLAVPMRRPMMPGQRFPGPGGMLIRRGGPRPPGRAGWAVRH